MNYYEINLESILELFSFESDFEKLSFT